MIPSRVRLGEVKMGGPLLEQAQVRKLGIKNKLFEVQDGRGMDEEVGWEDSNILVV
jgi:hypothetical protein